METLVVDKNPSFHLNFNQVQVNQSVGFKFQLQNNREWHIDTPPRCNPFRLTSYTKLFAPFIKDSSIFREKPVATLKKENLRLL